MVGFLNSILIVKSVLLFFKSEVFTIFLVNVGAEWRKPRELNLLRRGVKQRRTTHEWRTTCFFPHQVASVFLSQCWSWSDWAPAQINHSFTFFHNLQGVFFKWDPPISVPKRKPPSSHIGQTILILNSTFNGSLSLCSLPLFYLTPPDSPPHGHMCGSYQPVCLGMLSAITDTQNSQKKQLAVHTNFLFSEFFL